MDQDAFGNTTIGIYKPPGSGSSGSSTTIKHSINSQVSVYTDTNANGTPDIITIGVDANQDGLISAGETVSTRNRNQASLLDADSHIADWHAQGLIDNATYNNYTTWSTAQLVDTGNTGGAGAPPVYTLPPEDNPIGAFYESVSPVNDNALSISKKTPVILDAGNANAKLTAAQLAARDTNADGRLTAGELAGLNVWTDAGEDGTKTGSEITSLTSYLSGQNLSGVAAADYGFYTQGNGRWIDAAALISGAAVPSFVQTGAPAIPGAIANGTFTATSNYAALRSFSTVYVTSSMQAITWGANDIRMNNGNTTDLIGSDANDTMDAAQYPGYLGPAVAPYIVTSGLVNFYAGGGNDSFGGSNNNDNIWGGTGNDALYGYAGHDKVYEAIKLSNVKIQQQGKP